MMMDKGSLNIQSSDINLEESEGPSIHGTETSTNGMDATPPAHPQVANVKYKGEPKKEGLKLRRKRKSRKTRTEFGRLSKKKEESVETVPPPLNTTQFLMSDYNFNKFSPDVKVDDHKDNEVEFLLKEFSKDYENTDVEDNGRLEMRSNARCDRMATLNREDLIHKYMQMDKEVKMLEMRLVMVKEMEEHKARQGEVEYDWRKGEAHMEPETAEKIRVFQNEIANLELENRELLGQVDGSDYEDDMGGGANGWTSDSSSDSNSSSSDDSSGGSASSSSDDSTKSDEVQSVVSNTCDGEDSNEAVAIASCDDLNQSRRASDESNCDQVSGVKEAITTTVNCPGEDANEETEADAKSDNFNDMGKSDTG